MNEDELRAELARLGERIPVGRPDVSELEARAGGRRRIPVAPVAAGVGVGVLVAGLIVFRPWAPGPVGGPSRPGVTATVTGTSSAVTGAPTRPTAPAAPVRWVGVSHAVIPVPKDWGTNATHCSLPTRDTVIVDDTDAWCGTLTAGVESVTLYMAPPSSGFTADSTYTVDGYEVQRMATFCEYPDLSGVWRCRGEAYLPQLDALFSVDSTTSARDVDDLLDQIRVLPDKAAVPPARYAAPGSAGDSKIENFVKRATASGLKVRVVGDPGPAGYITNLEPAAGTVVPLGTEVTATVTSNPSPASGIEGAAARNVRVLM